MASRYIWWDHARKMVRVYPANKRQYNDALSPKMETDYSQVNRSGSKGDPVSNLIAKIDSREWYREYKAVQDAIDYYRRKPYGLEMLKFIELYYWSNAHYKMEDLAYKLNVSPDTLRNWNRNLIRMIGKNRGWI